MEHPRLAPRDRGPDSGRSIACLLIGRTDLAASICREASQAARVRDEAGSIALSLQVQCEVALARDPPDTAEAARCFAEALANATKVGMHPLIANCHVVLAKLHRRIGEEAEAAVHFATATRMYCDMGLTPWRQGMEAAASVGEDWDLCR